MLFGDRVESDGRRRHRLGAGVRRTGVVHGSRTGILLRRNGQEPQHIGDDPAELRRARRGDGGVDPDRPQHRVRRGHRCRIVRRSEAVRPAESGRSAAPGIACRRPGHRDPDPGLRRLSNDVRGNHSRADHRRDGGSAEDRGLGGDPRRVACRRVRADRALAVRPRGMARGPGSAGLGGRHGGPRVGGGGRTGDPPGRRPADRLARHRDRSALGAAHDDRCRNSVVRLVRIQCGRCPAGKRNCRAGPDQHPCRGGSGDGDPGR